VACYSEQGYSPALDYSIRYAFFLRGRHSSRERSVAPATASSRAVVWQGAKRLLRALVQASSSRCRLPQIATLYADTHGRIGLKELLNMVTEWADPNESAGDGPKPLTPDVRLRSTFSFAAWSLWLL
jgi:hypothetical protein